MGVILPPTHARAPPAPEPYVGDGSLERILGRQGKSHKVDQAEHGGPKQLVGFLLKMFQLSLVPLAFSWHFPGFPGTPWCDPCGSVSSLETPARGGHRKPY